MSLSDTVVLMREGHIEQIGTPAQLYGHPATTFAAQFIGEPPMALIDGSALDYDAPVTVGLRPEAMSLGPAGCCDLDAVIADVEFLGGETRLALDHPAARGLAVILPGPAQFAPGQSVGVVIPLENRRLFNAATGILEKVPHQDPVAQGLKNLAPEDGHKAITSPPIHQRGVMK